jgi:hypothetical protein
MSRLLGAAFVIVALCVGLTTVGCGKKKNNTTGTTEVKSTTTSPTGETKETKVTKPATTEEDGKVTKETKTTKEIKGGKTTKETKKVTKPADEESALPRNRDSLYSSATPAVDFYAPISLSRREAALREDRRG